MLMQKKPRSRKRSSSEAPDFVDNNDNEEENKEENKEGDKEEDKDNKTEYKEDTAEQILLESKDRELMDCLLPVLKQIHSNFYSDYEVDGYADVKVLYTQD